MARDITHTPIETPRAGTRFLGHGTNAVPSGSIGVFTPKEADMRKVIPLVAGAIVAGAVGLLKRTKHPKKAAVSKAKRAVASAQTRGPRRSATARKK
jgi:hypothetical protein